MVTLRVHMDDVPATNAPLLIAPGSHAEGRVSVGAIQEVVRRRGTRVCIAEAGDVWLYATPILHASEAAAVPGSRRVLQVDFAAENLPDGLEWLGVSSWRHATAALESPVARTRHSLANGFFGVRRDSRTGTAPKPSWLRIPLMR